MLDESRDDFERTLLASSAADEPASGACERALAGLGLGASVAVVVATSTATQTVAGSVGASSMGTTTAAAAKGGALLVAKWLGAVLIGGALAFGSVHYVQRVASPATRQESKAREPGDSPRVAASSLPMPAVVSTEVAPLASGIVQPPSSAGATVSKLSFSMVAPAAPVTLVTPVARGPVAPQGLTAPSPESSGDTLPAQLEALGAIRASLGRGDASQASARIDAFRTANPTSPMMEEVSVLRIDALILAGRRAEALVLADTFLQTYPLSAYGQHVRTSTKSP
jgi:hypothetical protein